MSENSNERAEANTSNSPSENQSIAAMDGLYGEDSWEDWSAAFESNSQSSAYLRDVSIVDSTPSAGPSARSEGQRQSGDVRARPTGQDAASPTGSAQAPRAEFGQDGLPTRLHHPDGTTDTYNWRNGQLKEIRNSEGYSWKYEFDKWYLYDKDQKRTGDSQSGVQLLGPQGGTLHGPVTAESYRELVREAASAGTGRAEEREEVVSIGTSIRSEAVERNADGKITAVNYLDGTRRSFDYDKETGALVGVTNPNGDKMVRVGFTDSWKFEGQDDQFAVPMAMRVDEDGTFRTRMDGTLDEDVTYPSGSTNKSDTARREQLSFHDFATEAPQLVAGLAGEDGFLSRQELAAAMENPQFQGRDAQILAALYKTQDALQGLNEGDEYFKDNDGITVNDVNRLIEANKQHQQFNGDVSHLNFLTSNAAYISRLDLNNDQMVSNEEMAEILTSPTSGQQLKDAVAHLQQHADTIDPSIGSYLFGRDGLTIDQIKQYTENAKSPFADTASTINGALALASDSLSSERSTTLYRNGENPASSVTPDAVRQGGIGNCYFEASLSGVAGRRADDIVNMIKDNKDGTCTVTFPGAPDKPVTVKAPTEAEMALFNRAGPYGAWANVMEKAHGEFRRLHQPRELSGNEIADLPAEHADGGGPIAPVIKLLTGNEVTQHHLGDAGKRDQIRQDLAAAFAQGENRVVAAETPADAQGDRGKTQSGFATQHAYAITNFRPEGPGGGSITIRNPWGGPQSTTSGEITITFDEFVRNFSWVHIEKKP